MPAWRRYHGPPCPNCHKSPQLTECKTNPTLGISDHLSGAYGPLLQGLFIIIKWWLGIPISTADSKYPLCSSALDPDCHHALTCRSGGDIIARHNKLRDCFANLCSKACLSPQLEKGPGLDFSRPADVLVPNWSLSNPAAFDLKVIHPLNTDLILEAS